MKLIVRSRRLMGELDLAERYVVVSITDLPPFGEPAKIPQRWGLDDILRLEFFDLDLEWALAKGHTIDAKTVDRCMKPEHGQAIAAFLRKHRKIPVVVIHCEAGALRSPSVAFAIADHLKLPRSVIDWAARDTQIPPPNAHVYGVTRCALASYGRRKENLPDAAPMKENGAGVEEET